MTLMEDLSLHILDIVENAVRAGGNNIKVNITEDRNADTMTVTIEDDGKGMDRQTLEKATDPFFTTTEGRHIGLGLSLLAQAAQQTGGSLEIDSKLAKGTKVSAVFNAGHPDMKPIGNLLDTISALTAANPRTRFVFDCKKGDYEYHFDSSKQD